MRSSAVLREIVEQYVVTGEPVGSRTLSRLLPIRLSPATIRNVMADLTDAGLLFAPHTSAGRLPTERGLRLFVDGLLQFGELTEDDRRRSAPRSPPPAAAWRTRWPRPPPCCPACPPPPAWCWPRKATGRCNHIEFVPLGSGRALVVLVNADGQVENRVIEIPPGVPPSALQQASNYLNARLAGRTLDELRRAVAEEIAADRTELDALAAQRGRGGARHLDRRGPRRLADRARPGAAALRRDQIETSPPSSRCSSGWKPRKRCCACSTSPSGRDGVRIFIGAESGLFGTSGVSMVVAPARNAGSRIVGAIGVIGPTRINYGRIIRWWTTPRG